MLSIRPPSLRKHAPDWRTDTAVLPTASDQTLAWPGRLPALCDSRQPFQSERFLRSAGGLPGPPALRRLRGLLWPVPPVTRGLPGVFMELRFLKKAMTA
jgi:hypothetical protein